MTKKQAQSVADTYHRLIEVPKALDAIVNQVLAYRPKAKSKPARRRKRQATKIAKQKK
jgi:hypothetical protein